MIMQPETSKFSLKPKNVLQDPYNLQKPGNNKMKVALVVGGIVLLLVLLALVAFSGGGVPGKVEMKNVLQPTSEALGIIEDYEKDLEYSPTINNVALAQILIRGNYQELNTQYNKLYKPSKRFSSNPKPDTRSQELLDESRRNNTLDTEINKVLIAKITKAENSLAKARKVVVNKKLNQQIVSAQKDMQAILEMLNKTNTL